METVSETTRSGEAILPSHGRGAITRPRTALRRRAGVALRTSPNEQAFRILHAGFVAAPMIAGVDKFTQLLSTWDDYLAPQIERRLPMSGRSFMQLVGGIEIVAGLLTAARPKIGSFVVAGWLGGIIGNLVLGRRSYDVALRDFGLMLGALALGRLAVSKERGTLAVA